MVLRRGAALLAAMILAAGAAQAQQLPDDFVYLRDLDPSIRQDIRYTGANNFVGRRLAGYDANECIVKRAVGLALVNVQRELAPQQLSLKMLDCYRPARASRDMVAWAQDGNETPAQRRYNPTFSKSELFRLGYIAANSGHSTGAAVDLTLVDLRAPKGPPFDPNRAYADCTAPEAMRAPEDSVDMGTSYDCSDAKAYTAAKSISPAQRRWRRILLGAMTRQGFVNFSKEWWHFSLPGTPRVAHDFPIRPRPR
ncbi:M15 family metallopeptidase [Rhodopseudomonas sp. HC1]|uniref:M15 family metallopeptidase n=1 Tax=Rhodopseudomonas infernalis TaxID=2897386 RepID=UPI001EE8B2B7|nr:M15 family metallopeptidase [Rhodopseudomonas infernalis]MCG6204057.1 M15 family metallopeptidase [Rhodopseudomonas infernalis]